MHCLLVGINSKFIHSNPGLYSLKSYAEYNISRFFNDNDCIGSKAVIDIEIAEFTINQQISEILSGIYRLNPDYLFISCYIWNREILDKLLPELPKVLPDVPVFLGGPEVSYHPELIMQQYPNIAGIMIGEGEETFTELVASLYPAYAKLTSDESDMAECCLIPNISLSHISGMYLATGYTGERMPLSMDSVPFFYPDCNAGTFDNRIIYYESSRGCPYRCSYCLSSIDKSLRFRSIENVYKHLDYFLKEEVRQVKFVDRTFNANHEHALSVWKYINEHDNGVTNFHFEIAADIMTDEEIAVINSMRPGLVQLEIGVQTTNPETLRLINRYADTAHIAEVVAKLLAPHNAHIHLDLIAGLPQEDFASFKKSFDEVFMMHPHQLQLGFLKVLKGTDMETKAKDLNIRYTSSAPYEVLSTSSISYKELLMLKDIEYVLEDYYNSAQFTQTLPRLLSMYDSAFDFFAALAAYYRNHDYFVRVPARSRRYDILLEFAGNSEEIRDLLSLDYYLREKPKSKPDFVHNIPDMDKIDYSKRDPITGNHIIICR